MVPRRPAQALRERTRGFLIWSSALLTAAAAVGIVLGLPWPLAVAFVVGVAAWFGRDDFPALAHVIQGAEGEETVARILEPLGARGYRIIHDLDTGRGNVDHVVVGPTGVSVIETKAWSRRVYLAPGPTLKCGGIDQRSTLKQVYAEVFEIRRRLERVGMSGWVDGYVALSRTSLAKGPIDIRGISIVEAQDLPNMIMSGRRPLSDAEVARATAAILRGDAPVEVRSISFEG